MIFVILSKFSPPALSFLRSCKVKELSTIFLWIASDSEPLPVSNSINNIRRFPQELVSQPAGIQHINLLLQHYTNVNLTTIDESIAAWLVSEKAELDDNIKLMLQTKKNIERVLAKNHQAIAAKAAGLDLLNTYYLNGIKNIDEIPFEDFPLCLRPSSPGSVTPNFKVDIVKNKEALKVFISGRTLTDQGIIAQPFKNVPNLVVHGSRKLDGQILGLQGFLVERKFEGVTLTIRPTVLPKLFLRKCVKCIEFLEITGPFHFEFLHDRKNNADWFLEVNARLGGTTAKVYALGYDEPGFLLQSYGHNIQVANQLITKTASSKLALFKYLIHTLKNEISPLDYPDGESSWLRFLHTLKAILFCRDDIFTMKDIKGGLSVYSESFLKKLG